MTAYYELLDDKTIYFGAGRQVAIVEDDWLRSYIVYLLNASPGFHYTGKAIDIIEDEV
jgi:hypothetical protein